MSIQKKWKRLNYTKVEFEKAVIESKSIRQSLQKLGLRACGGNYKSFKKLVDEWKINTSHFTGSLWNKGRKLGPKRFLSDYLDNKFPIQSHALRVRLLRENVFKAQCNKCKLDKWNGLPISLELEHKNGDHSDNSLTNLELLCPNCHAQTSTWRGRNKKKSI